LSRHRTTAIAVGIAVVGTVVEWMRLPAVAAGTLWAEDARRFLNNAVAQGSFPALFTPYAGYLHTIPRIIAGIAVSFTPVDAWAFVMSFGSCLVAGSVAALVFVCSRAAFAGWTPRVMVSAITLLDPLAPHEVLGNTANLHWYFLWLAPWLILYRPRSRVGAWALGIAALFAGLTEIQMVFFTPLLAWQFKDRRRWPTRGLFLIGLAAQILTTLISPRGTFSATHLIGVPSLVDGYFINAVSTIWLPTSASIGWVFTHGAGLIPLLLFLPFLLAAIWGFAGGSSATRTLIATMLLGSFLLYVAAVEATPAGFSNYANSTPAQWASPWLTRYGVVPSMMLLALIPLAIWGRKRASKTPVSLNRVRSRRARTARWVSIALMVALLFGQFFPATTRRDSGPLWQPQVAAKRAFCESRPASTMVSLAGAPGAAWLVNVPCAILKD
jgi:hypothetical protein